MFWPGQFLRSITSTVAEVGKLAGTLPSTFINCPDAVILFPR
jgi:hypothetical protein